MARKPSVWWSLRWVLPHRIRIALAIRFTHENRHTPPIRVAPDFRLELEGVLEQGETLSQFVENAVRTTVAKRKNQAEFIRRGIAAIDATKADGSGIPADVVVSKLEAKLAAARLVLAQRGG